MNSDLLIASYFIGAIIWGVIWAIVAQAVVKNKGYEEEAEKYFVLGFFFSFIPVIIAATKPNRNAASIPQQTNNSTFDDLEKLARLKEQGVITEEEFNKMKAECLKKI